ncbi:hypothetical protein CYMTET_15096 [Cymbomonas tetramitiformis]|uniref:CCHC-type domain-containing protein n=1 Tax=Cymbomonas tetramitiformis TaxID=36881 RepID=A0AAE0L9P0_9CHLO|nr:hypothetical protein CYMTET_15096 [Cymbomonas tetramitiformis]
MLCVNDEVRKEFSSGLHMPGALLRLVRDSARRFNDNKRKALTATRHLPSAQQDGGCLGESADNHIRSPLPPQCCTRTLCWLGLAKDPIKTVAGWKAQYPLDLHFPDFPSLAEAHAHKLYGPLLKLPPAAPKRKGRSKLQKRKEGVLERFGGKKRTFTCSKCKRAGHRASKCPLIV